MIQVKYAHKNDVRIICYPNKEELKQLAVTATNSERQQQVVTDNSNKNNSNNHKNGSWRSRTDLATTEIWRHRPTTNIKKSNIRIRLKSKKSIRHFPSPRLNNPACLTILFTHNWKENRWIHAFSKRMSTNGRAKLPRPGLNSGGLSHFQRTSRCLKKFGLVWLGWVGFYGISTVVGYLILNPLYTYIYIYIYDLVSISNNSVNRAIGLMSKVFTNGPGDRDSFVGRFIPKTQKMVLDTTLLNIQHYMMRIKGKVEQSRE